LEDKYVHCVLSAWEGGYRSEPAFHNALHAADITQSVYHALVPLGLGHRLPSSLSLSMIVATMFHDVGHPGVNNTFLVATGDPLALRYNDRGVLENMHCSTGFELLKASGVDFFGALGNEVARSVRKSIVGIVLATDMEHHRAGTAELKDVIERALPWDDAEMQTVVSKQVVHVSDIGSCTRPWETFSRWTDRVMEEFFSQADRERQLNLSFAGGLSRGHTNLDRNKPFNVPLFQLGFVKNVYVPAFNVLCTIPDFDLTCRSLCLEENTRRLTEDGEAYKQKMEQSPGAA